MANRDHALDEKIQQAAREEFLEKGFRKALLQTIAAKAGTTTGAIYTRYKSKDELFCSLLQDVMDAFRIHGEELQQNYLEAQRAESVEDILQAICSEEAMFLNLLFRHHDACVLLFCRSEGSSIAPMLEEAMNHKVEKTVAYFSVRPGAKVDLDGVGLLIKGQMLLFREILEKGYSQEKACSCMETVELYMNAGWKALFEAMY